MDARELRIGNLVLDPEGLVSKILSISTESNSTDGKYYLENDYNGPPEDLRPIPLSEEWLLKFGFEKYGKTKLYKNTKGRVSVTLTSNQFGKFSGSSDFLLNDFYYIPIKHVHQLQNLYFALTGEELTQ